MRFDFTHGGVAKYSVSLYGFNVEDKYYFRELDEAKRFFEEMTTRYYAKGTLITLRDVSGRESVIISMHNC